ncbi:MAG: 4Fe-4S ferredoxin [Deltaproteobacteria bacterium]|nr:4Fe-4S ferredoxin [Deltaproteobacteria bacterium]
MPAEAQLEETTPYPAAEIKAICREAGADDVGLVDLGRAALDRDREGILHVYPLTRTIISLVVTNNRENLQSPARYVANEEYHHTGDRISHLAREILRRLNRRGIRGVVVNKSWPMAVNRMPGKIWDVGHKTMAVEAGLGQMGLNRLVLHPGFGAAIQLDSILINAAVDVYDQPLAENPCFNCNLCAAVCPTGAISPDRPFDFLACLTHTYRDNYIGFANWVEALVTAQNIDEYHQEFDPRETAQMWQSLMFRLNYRCSYCMAVCPAGEEVKPGYLRNKKQHLDTILRPLKDRQEPVYVTAGSPAAERAAKNPAKEVRVVKGMARKA